MTMNKSSVRDYRVELPQLLTDRPLAPVVQKLDSAIHRINLYPVDNY